MTVELDLFTFALLVGVLTLAPGADTMLVIRNVLRAGTRDGLLTTLGIGSGLFVHAGLSAIGVSAILMHSSAAFTVVKLAGACYLIVLGLQSLNNAARMTHRLDAEGLTASGTRNSRTALREGFLSNVLNPKPVVFYLAVLPQFIGPDDPVFARSMLLAGIHFVETLIWLGGVSLLVNQARRLLVRSIVRRWLEGLCGGLLVGLGLQLALVRR